MRILMLADVHANWDALLALQRAESQPDAVLFAGDAVGYGPDPVNCVRWLWANASLAVRGNHEAALLDLWEGRAGGADLPVPGAPPELQDAARETLAHARAHLTSNDLAGLRHWPLTGAVTLAGARFFLVHATPAEPLSGRLNAALGPEADLHRLFDGVPAEVIVVGHTHVPALRRLGDKLIVNPGSLGQPRYGVPDATYAVWDDGRVQIKHLHYHPEAAVQRLHLAGLSPEVTLQLAEILTTGLMEAA